MIFNFDSVEIKSLSGIERYGEYNDKKSMVAALEKYRKDNRINSQNHTVLMIGITRRKNHTVIKKECCQLAYLEGQWVVLVK